MTLFLLESSIPERAPAGLALNGAFGVSDVPAAPPEADNAAGKRKFKRTGRRGPKVESVIAPRMAKKPC
jgi:hypothetical protein